MSWAGDTTRPASPYAAAATAGPHDSAEQEDNSATWPLSGATFLATNLPASDLASLSTALPPPPSFPGLQTAAVLGVRHSWQTLLDSCCKLPDLSCLTRRRSVDVVVGLTLQCLLLSLRVLLLQVARSACFLVLAFNAVLLTLAKLLGFVRPLRLLKDTSEVRQQLESATLIRVAGYNLVVFEGLKKRRHGSESPGRMDQTSTSN